MKKYTFTTKRYVTLRTQKRTLLLILIFIINGISYTQEPHDLLSAWSSNTENGITYPGCEQWKITYPTGDEEKDLCNTVASNRQEFYYVNPTGDGIVFRAPVRSNNGTTPNSDNIRSELREREIDGSTDVYWTTEGNHVIYVEQAITHLPINKDELVATQIHGNKDEGIDDSMVVRLNGSTLILSFNGGVLRSNVTIKNNYTLGTKHEVIFQVIDDKHYCYYSEDGNLKSAFANGNADSYLVTDNGNPVLMDLNYGDAYFKVGNYTQSNPGQEGDDTDDPDNYGEVIVYDMYVDHNGDSSPGEDDGDEDEDEETSTCTADAPDNRIANNIEETSVIFNWSFDPEIDHYNIRYKPEDSSSWSTLTSLRESEGEFTVSGSTASKTVSGLSEEITYNWEIRAKCEDNSASDYAAGNDFTTLSSSTSECTADAPDNRIVDNIGETSVTFNWSFDPEIDHYNIRYRPESSNSWNTLTSLRESEDEFTVSGSTASKTVSELSSDTTYNWEIRAKCEDGNASDYTAGNDFTTLSSDTSECTADTPTIRIANDIEETSVTFNWSYDPEIDHYNIRYRPESSSSWTTLTSLKEDEGEFTVSGSVASKTVSDLSSDTTYNWEIRGKCEDGNASDYTSGNDFTTSASIITSRVVQIIKRNATDYALDGQGGGANRQNIHLWGTNVHNENQQWIEIDRGNGYYSYQKINTDFCIDGGNGGTEEQNVYIWACNDNNQNQQWEKIDVGEGAVKLIKRNAPSYAINGGDGGENRQNVYLSDASNTSQNIHWFITPISGVNDHSLTQANIKLEVSKSTIYPNPFIDKINISTDNNTIGFVQLIDLNGREIKTSPISSNLSLENLDNLRKGIYFLQIFNKNNQMIEVRKLIK